MDGARRAGWVVARACRGAVAVCAATAGVFAVCAVAFVGTASAYPAGCSRSGTTVTCTYTSGGQTGLQAVRLYQRDGRRRSRQRGLRRRRRRRTRGDGRGDGCGRVQCSRPCIWRSTRSEGAAAGMTRAFSLAVTAAASPTCAHAPPPVRARPEPHSGRVSWSRPEAGARPWSPVAATAGWVATPGPRAQGRPGKWRHPAGGYRRRGRDPVCPGNRGDRSQRRSQRPERSVRERRGRGWLNRVRHGIPAGGGGAGWYGGGGGGGAQHGSTSGGGGGGSSHAAASVTNPTFAATWVRRRR